MRIKFLEICVGVKWGFKFSKIPIICPRPFRCSHLLPFVSNATIYPIMIFQVELKNPPSFFTSGFLGQNYP